MARKINGIEEFSELLGFDVLEETENKEYVRARQGVWLSLYVNGYSYSKIGRIFGRSHQAVSKGVDKFEDERKRGDEMTLKYCKLLEPYWW